VIDGIQKVRRISDMSIGDCMRIFYGYDQLIGPLWRQVQTHVTDVPLVPCDMISFVMVVSQLSFYGISAKAFYDNVDSMHKPLTIDWSISYENKFTFLSSFKAKNNVNRRFLNETHAQQRQHWGKL
jgi:hypothetical protein